MAKYFSLKTWSLSFLGSFLGSSIHVTILRLMNAKKGEKTVTIIFWSKSARFFSRNYVKTGLRQ